MQPHKYLKRKFSSAHSLSHFRLFANPWTVAHQASLYITNFWSLLKTHVHQVSDAIQPSHPLLSPSPPALNLSQNQGLFLWASSSNQMSNIGVSASASALPVNIQDWFPLGWTGWISLQSKGLSRVFSTVEKHQFFAAQLSLWPHFYMHTWLQEKPQLRLDGLCWQSNVSAF